MTPLQIFNNSLFVPEFNINCDDDNLIILSWTIKETTYNIYILFNGDISASMSNSRHSEKLNNVEIETIYNMLNQSFIYYGSEDTKLNRYITYAHN
jgi:hypothetical protein